MEDFEALTSQLVKETYAKQGCQNMRTRQKQLDTLLKQRKIPKVGYSDSVIEFIVQELSIMDSNNFQSNCGVGEREGRVFSTIVSNRHYSLSHGIGRSGNISEEQPKAAGSSIIYKLTNSMAAHALELSGFNKPVNSLVLPFATGMTLTMCMLTLKTSNPTALYVIWSRIDQKSCFKSIITAGLKPLVVDNIMVNGQMQTNVAQIKELLEHHGQDILCVLSTTSCFAPRQPDLVDSIARLCKTHCVGHVINNAYGLQCPYISKLINRATVVGRVDAVVQSTDKNFMVPVGGAIVSSPDPNMVLEVAKLYPGRASISPILDLFITLLSMGGNGLLGLWDDRQKLFRLMSEKLELFASSRGERLLICPNNSISIGVTVESLCAHSQHSSGEECVADPSLTCTGQSREKMERSQSAGTVSSSSAGAVAVTFLGSMLFQRNVSGCRVVPQSSAVTRINGIEFISWGAHMSDYPAPYFTAACSIGLTVAEVTMFLDRLDKTWTKYGKSNQGNGTMTVIEPPVPSVVDSKYINEVSEHMDK